MEFNKNSLLLLNHRLKCMNGDPGTLHDKYQDIFLYRASLLSTTDKSPAEHFF